MSGDVVRQSLEDDNGKHFDQFKGKKTTYRDEIYNTKIDESNIKEETKILAEKVDKEIKGESSGGNIHLQEDRNQIQ